MKRILSFIGIISIALVVGPNGHCQTTPSEHLITSAGDTLLGKVRRNLWTHKNEVSVRIADGKKIRYHYKDVKEFRSKKMTFVILQEQSARSDRVFYLELLVTVEGKAKLLVDGQYNFHFDHYVGLDERYMPVTPSNLVHHIWPALMRCSAFEKVYKDVSIDTVSRWDKDIPKLTETILYYNEHCL